MKKLNKTISLVLSIIMAICMMSSVSAEETSVIINEHFEGELPASVWTGDYVISGGVNKRIESVSDKTQFYCRLGKTLESGAMITSYDVMIPTVAAIRIKQVWDAASGGKRPYYIQATGAGKLTINGGEFGTYAAGKWFNLTEVVDVTNKKVAIYLDGDYVDEYDWNNNGEATGINNIQTQYSGNMIYIDNVFVKEYADKNTALTALTAMLASKIKLASSDITVTANGVAKNAITPVTTGAVMASYDITASGKSRLMQIYDNQASAKRAVLIQLSSANVISVNGNDTGVTWDGSKTNNLTLIYNAQNKTSTVYYNHTMIGRENYAVHSDNGINLADIRTQDESGNGITISNAYAMTFPSYEDAVKYHSASHNSACEETLAYYGVNSGDIATAISDYSRDILSITYTSVEKSAIINKMSKMIPYTDIFSENFNDITELSGYTVSTDATVVNNTLKITNDGARARLLKTITNYDKLVVECDFMQQILSNVDSIFRITDNQGVKEAIKVSAINGDLVFAYGPKEEENTFKSKVIVPAYETDRWYNLKVCADLATKKMSVYVDDVFVGNFDFMYTDIENMRRAFDSYTDSAGSYYLDNIKIYNDDIMEAAASVMIDAKATGNINLPETVAGFLCAWKSNNESAIAADGTVNRPETVSENVILTATVSNGIASIDTKFALRAAALKNFEVGEIIYAGVNEFSTRNKAEAVGVKFIKINKNNNDINGNVIVAMYDGDGRFVDVAIKEVIDGYCSIGAGFTEDVAKIKIFIWNENIAKMLPCIEPVEVN